MIEVKFKKMREGFELPKRESKEAACFDVKYCGTPGKVLTMLPHKVYTVPLGFSVEIPEGYEMQLRPRSGLARRDGITVINSPATIDSDYRGEVGVLLIKLTEGTFEFKPGDRVCQMLISKLEDVEFTVSEELNTTARGESGFGSTGV